MPLVRRVVQGGLVAALVTTLAFFLIQLAPGHPLAGAIDDSRVTPEVRAAVMRTYGFDRPLPEQYARYVGRALRGDLGPSTSRGQPVATAIAGALPNTLLLMGTAIGGSLVLGVALGIAQAARRGSRFDRTTRALTLGFRSIPDFWLAALLLMWLAGSLHLFPVRSAEPLFLDGPSAWDRFTNTLHRLALPALTLVLLSTATVARHQRAALLDVLPEDFVRTATAKGLDGRTVLLRHAWRNALLPVVTLVGLALPALLGGAVFVERVFTWPGMGSLLVGAVEQRDYFLLTGCVLVGSLVVVAGSVLADLLALAVDPRQRGE